MSAKKPLLTTNNAKTIKGEKKGIKTFILYLAPFTQNSKNINVCSHASKGCIEACLFKSGAGGIYTNVQQGRMRKTEYFLQDRAAFMFQLKSEIEKAIKKNNDEYTLAVRLNGTSDLPWEKYNVFEGKNIFEIFPNVQFYDYTKNHYRYAKQLPSNYHLTFSRSEENEEKALEILSKGHNAAFVFTKLPETYKGYKVINGDESDVRFLDEKNVIVGLKYKKLTGKGADNKAGINSGFVIEI